VIRFLTAENAEIPGKNRAHSLIPLLELNFIIVGNAENGKKTLLE
jgi:hypothetical protein